MLIWPMDVVSEKKLGLPKVCMEISDKTRGYMINWKSLPVFEVSNIFWKVDFLVIKKANVVPLSRTL